MVEVILGGLVSQESIDRSSPHYHVISLGHSVLMALERDE